MVRASRKLWLLLIFIASVLWFVWRVYQTETGITGLDISGWIGAIGSLASLVGFAWLFLEKKQTSNKTNEKILKKRYYQALVNKASRLDLSIIADSFAEQGQKITLDKVYQDQYVQQETKQLQISTENIQIKVCELIPLLTAVADDNNKRLVILGKVGSGKSSFIDYLSWSIANSWLSSTTVETPFPKRPVVRIILRNIAVNMADDAHHKIDTLLKQAIDQEIQNLLGSTESLPHYYDELLEQGIILLDGLDEVTRNDGRLLTLLDAIDAFSKTLSDTTRLIITSRPYAYDKHRLTDFKVIELEPMDDEQIKAFIQHWYKTMPPKGIWQHGASGQADNLIAIILDEKYAYLKKLAETPLTLTLITSLHYARNVLPHSRAELYESSLGLLLDRWQQRLQVYKKGQGFEDYEYKALNVPVEELTTMLMELAYKVHRRQQQEQKSQTTSETDTQNYTDISRDEIIATFDDGLRRELDCRADNLLDFMQHRSAVLIATSDQHFSFVHRSFQEFLVAKHIAENPDWKDEIESCIRQDHRWWREVFLLLMGIKSVHSFGDAMSAIMLWIPSLPDNNWQQTKKSQWALIRLSANAAIETKLSEKQNKRPAYAELLKHLQAWLIKHMHHKDLPIKDRAEAGRLLGLLGDPRKGVGVKRINNQVLPDIDWVYIPAKGKTFMMGSDNNFDDRNFDAEKPAHPQTMPNDYYLSRYPVTNAQYALFVEAGGYQNHQYWSEKGWQYVQENQIKYPMLWNNSQLNIANHPVSNLNLFETKAFICWLNTIQQEEGSIYLPTEQEWEFVAKGEKNLTFPWGNGWQTGLANTIELDIGQTLSAVGLFQQPSPFGLDDLIGNVAEWIQISHTKEILPFVRHEPNFIPKSGHWVFNKSSMKPILSLSHHYKPLSGFRLLRSLETKN